MNLVRLFLCPSHLAANHSSVSLRPSPDEPNRTTSSGKSRDEILRPTKWMPSVTWLRLEIMSIKILNRIGDKWQPWQSLSPTGNESYLLPAMRPNGCIKIKCFLLASYSIQAHHLNLLLICCQKLLHLWCAFQTVIWATHMLDLIHWYFIYYS